MLQIFILFYIIWLIWGELWYLIHWCNGESALEYYGLVTKYLYEKTEMNIFGCFICAIFYYISYPIIFIFGKIGMFVFWLFHIGRNWG